MSDQGGWVKSGRCESSWCVEARPVTPDATAFEVRDSKDPDGARLHLPLEQWQDFIAAVRDGRFDFPVERKA